MNDNHNGGKQSVDTPFIDRILNVQDTFPIITFDIGAIDLGKIKKGEQREVEFTFTNTGTATLVIELATACKCTSLDWSREPVRPGDKGFIKAIYDTTYQKLGMTEKAIDIIANTRPIVVEAWFKATVVE